MDVRKYLDAHEVGMMRVFPETEYGRIVERALQQKADELLREVVGEKAQPKVGTENMRDDVRWKLGMIEAVQWLGKLIQEADRSAKSDGGES